jgi:hypothetical protein
MASQHPPRPSGRRRNLFYSFFATLIVVCLVGLATLVSGHVRGREFSPSHFTTRSFRFWEIPLVHLQISPIRRVPEPNNVANYLQAKRHLKVPNNPPTLWHLVQLDRGISSSTFADAEILTSYLELTDTNNKFVWEEWSNSHPQAAAIFWPYVQQLAEKELYLLIPPLFALAEQNTDADSLRGNIDAWLPNAYLELAQDLLAANHPLLAENLLRDALQQYPQESQLVELQQSLSTNNSSPTNAKP